MSTTITIEIEGVEFEVTGTYDPGSPGRFSGPPEDCYDDDPSEFSVDTALMLVGSERIDLNELPSLMVPDELWDAISDRCLAHEDARALEEQWSHWGPEEN